MTPRASGVAILGALLRPLRPASSGLARAVGDDRYGVSIREILETVRGEIPRLPRFGSRLRRLRMEPNDTALEGELRAEVADAVAENDPRLAVSDARVRREGKRTWLDVTFTVRGERDARTVPVPWE